MSRGAVVLAGLALVAAAAWAPRNLPGGLRYPERGRRAGSARIDSPARRKV